MILTEGGSPVIVLLIYVAIIGAMFYFLSRPQKKEKKRLQEMLANLEIGDTVLTSSGFYGIVIDIADDTVIVEFGNNKNCRIPMQKEAIRQAEKPDSGSSSTSDSDKLDKSDKSDKSDKK